MACAILGALVLAALCLPAGAHAADFKQNGTVVAVPDGVYEIHCHANTKYVVEAAGGGTANGVALQIYSSNGTDAQRFRFERKVNGKYAIFNVKSGRVMEVVNSSPDNHANVQQYDFVNIATQLWYVELMPDGALAFRNANSDKYLDVYSATFENKTKLTQYAGNGTDAQKFALEPVSVSIDSAANAGMVSVAGCSDQACTGKPRTPSLSVSCGAVRLAAGKDYSVSYSNNVGVGTATATVSGKGAYTGKVTRAFTIVPGRARLSSAKGLKPARGSGVLQARWGAAAGAGGYEVQVSASRGFSGKSTRTKRFSVSSKAGKRRSFKGAGLKRGKRYYVRVRAYKKAGKTTYYGAWSAAKSTKTRKR